jgi:hypothetical protein
MYIKEHKPLAKSAERICFRYAPLNMLERALHPM